MQIGGRTFTVRLDLITGEYGHRPDGGTHEIIQGMPVWRSRGVDVALDDRKKKKDAYDVYFCLANYPGGIDALVKEFQPLMGNGLVRESLGKTCGKFWTIDSIGPVWAAQVVLAAGGDYEFARRDAFERARALFAALGVKPSAAT